MAPRKRANRSIMALVGLTLLFWAVVLVGLYTLPAHAAEPTFVPGDLATYTPGVYQVCLVVSSTDTGPGGRPYVWARDRAAPGRVYHLHVGELARGCA